MSNCVVGSGGLRLPCTIIAEHSVEGCEHFSHDGHDDDLGFFLGGDEAIMEGFEGGTVTACAEGGHVKDVTDRHPTTIDARLFSCGALTRTAKVYGFSVLAIIGRWQDRRRPLEYYTAACGAFS